MEFGIFEILISLTVILVVGLYKYVNSVYDHWTKRGVPGPSPSFPFGNYADIFLRRKSLTEELWEIYKVYKDKPFVGYFAAIFPILMVNDPDLIKCVLIKDFNVFSGRGMAINKKEESLMAHLFNLDGRRWEVLRHKLTPAFTTGKLKRMFYLMSDCADNFEIYLKEKVSKNKVIEMREHAARYTIDVIGSCAFGLDARALSDEDSIFRKMGRKNFEPNFGIKVSRIIREMCPGLYKFLQLSIVHPEVTDFFVNLIKRTIEMRKNQKELRNDYVDLLMAIPKDNEADGFELTDSLLTAQAFVFFAAGFETSSTTISFTLWELARAPEVQEKLRQEILEYDSKCEGKFTYESVNDMKYLDMVIKESMRKNPPVDVLKRVATRDYVIPGTKITIPAGQRIHIPAHALHHDPKYFPKPEVFDPERFSDEAKLARHPMVFLPFGDGPKKCIGSRFAYCQVKIALIKIIKAFRVKPTTDKPYVIDKAAIILAPVGGLPLEFERISD